MLKVLIPTDFSECARNALTYSLELFEGRQVHFYLLNTFKYMASAEEMLISVDDILERKSKEGLYSELAFINSRPNLNGFSAETVLLKQDLPTAIEEVSLEQEIDMVIMGSKGASRVDEVLQRSYGRASNKPSQPMLIVPEKYRPRSHPKHFTIAIDSENPPILDSLKFLKMLTANVPDLQISLLSVDTNDLEKHRNIQDKISSYLGQRCMLHSIGNVDVVDGVVKLLDLIETDVLTMLTHRRSWSESLFNQGITRRTARRSKVPVLVLGLAQ